MESWTCIARKSQRVARNGDATRDVREGKKGKVQRADSDVPTPTINTGVDDPEMAVHVQVPTFRTKEVVVEKKTRPLVVLIQVLDPFPLLEHAGFNLIPLSRVVNSEVNYKSVQGLTLVVSLSKRAHTRSVMAAEYLIALVDALKA